MKRYGMQAVTEHPLKSSDCDPFEQWRWQSNAAD